MDSLVKTVEVKEIQLFNIPALVEELEEKDPSVKKAGVFKVVLPANVRSGGSSLNELLTLNDGKERLANAEKQFIVPFSHCPNLYGYRSYGNLGTEGCCSPKDVEDFYDCVTSLENWDNSKTCCNVDDAEALADHFFQSVLPKLASIKKPVCQKKKNLSQTIAQGKRDAKNVEKFMSSLNSMSAKQRRVLIEKSLLLDEREPELECGCGGCLTDDDNLPADGVMYGKGIEVLKTDYLRMTPSFGLYCLASTSLLRLLKHHYAGISMPFLYFGTLHSIFPAHVEDYSLYSWNYLHFGAAKIWIVVPPHAALKLTLSIMNSSPNLVHSSCINLLGHKYFVPTPQWLQDHGIPFKVIVQKEGESVIVAPNAVHWGWNTGYNVAEASNFATNSWVPFGVVAPKCACVGEEVHMDLRRLIAAARPDLLQCYLDKSIPKGEDDLFYKSILRLSEAPQIFQPDVDNKVKVSDSGEEVDSDEGNSVEDSPLFPDAPNKRSGRKSVICPVVLCSQEYKYGSKDKLLRHIKKVHDKPKDVFTKAMEGFNLLFPERNKSTRRQCEFCPAMIAGRGAQMKRHVTSKHPEII